MYPHIYTYAHNTIPYILYALRFPPVQAVPHLFG